tara:strand:- start:145 stop:525 length:381 start_codon:yes stop_codon:yes gene_type:complete
MKKLFLVFISVCVLDPLGSRAAELNFDGLNEYTPNQAEINNFSNIIPNDWTYHALNRLAINRDCNFITRKSDSVSSRQSFTRHEAALIIRTCLKDVSKLSKEEKRLLDEFKLEIQSIKNLYIEIKK